MRGGAKEAGVAGVELGAPEHYVEVIGDGGEVAIDGGGGERLELLLNLHHAVGHHAVGDEVFAHILGVQVSLMQAGDEDFWVAGEDVGFGGGEEVNGVAGDGDYVGEDLVKGEMDAAEEFGEVGVDCLFGGAEFEGQKAAGGEVGAGGAEELDCVEAVQLRGLRVGDVEEDGVECVGGGFEVVTAVREMDVDARVEVGRLGGKELAGDGDECGVEFDVVDALDGGMTERLGDAAVDSAADEENVFWGGVLEERVVDGFFGGGFVGGIGEEDAVRIDAADGAGLSDCEVAVDGVARGYQVEALPEALLGFAIKRRGDVDD